MVVIALAALLMAIVVPLSSGMSASQSRSECAFNLRTLGQSLLAVRNDYHAFPRDGYEVWKNAVPPGIGNTDAVRDPNVPSYYSGVVGLYSMYYLTAYAQGAGSLAAPARQNWFRGGNYLRNLQALHCPGNRVVETASDVPVPPYLADPNTPAGDPNSASYGTSGYGNYDINYRRDWFSEDGLPYSSTPVDRRNLLTAYPPADTLVTYCPHHRRSQNLTRPRSGDEDIVLFADGTVMTLPSYDPTSTSPAILQGYGTMNPALWFSYWRAQKAGTSGS